MVVGSAIDGLADPVVMVVVVEVGGAGGGVLVDGLDVEALGVVVLGVEGVGVTGDTEVGVVGGVLSEVFY